MPYFRAIADGLPSQTRFPSSQSPSQSHSRASSPPLSWLNALDPDLDPDTKDDDDEQGNGDGSDSDGAADMNNSHTSPVPASTSPLASDPRTGARVRRPPLPAHPSDHTGSERTHVESLSPGPDPGPSTPGAPLLPIHNVPTAASTSSSARRSKGSHKTARRTGTPGWVREGVRVHWARFLRRVGGTGDVELGESESIVLPSDEDPEEDGDGDGVRTRAVRDTGGGGGDAAVVANRRSRTQSAEEEMGKGVGASVVVSAVSNENGNGNGLANGNGNGYAADLRGYNYSNRNEGRDEYEDEDDASTVDEVVVDRTWGRALTGSDSTDGDADSGGGAPSGKGGTHGHLPRAEPGGGSRASNAGGGRDSPSQLHLGGGGGGGEGGEKGISAHSFWGLCLPLSVVRYQLWPHAMVFFSTRFVNEKSEAHYRKEVWFQSKVRPSCLL